MLAVDKLHTTPLSNWSNSVVLFRLNIMSNRAELQRHSMWAVRQTLRLDKASYARLRNNYVWRLTFGAPYHDKYISKIGKHCQKMIPFLGFLDYKENIRLNDTLFCQLAHRASCGQVQLAPGNRATEDFDPCSHTHTLTHPFTQTRLAHTQTTVTHIHVCNRNRTLTPFPSTFSARVIGKSFDITDYGVCFIEDMLVELPESTIIVTGCGPNMVLAIPRRGKNSLNKYCPHCLIYHHSPSALQLFTPFCPSALNCSYFAQGEIIFPCLHEFNC